MIMDLSDLRNNPDLVEDIEKSTLRMVTLAIYDYRTLARDIFKAEFDPVSDIGEDITREALDRLGMSRIDQRLFGKIDYKRARYLFHPEYAVRQALFIDSKSEKIEGQNTATLQLSQLSMEVRQKRAGKEIQIKGKIPEVIDLKGVQYITTTIFVKYNYDRDKEQGVNELKSITIAAVPMGILQDRYNPSSSDTIWLAGRNAPSLGEEFRVRLSFARLKQKASWRVQEIPMLSDEFSWSS
ncbi:MAG: SfiI family type II restriction endonuclease [Roseiflexus sp.]|nr:SfiI family type II restriction endonuclease [Roseiflexus sp.]MDW8147970.1 SfiI family type II restriction endonuclease [Roseiflexaceae bacterium]